PVGLQPDRNGAARGLGPERLLRVIDRGDDVIGRAVDVVGVARVSVGGVGGIAGADQGDAVIRCVDGQVRLTVHLVDGPARGEGRGGGGIAVDVRWVERVGREQGGGADVGRDAAGGAG